MANVLIFGSGGVGSLYGYILHKAACKVTATCRSNYDTVKSSGITIESVKRGTLHYNPIAVRTSAEASTHGPFDYIIVCSKAFHGTAKLIAEAVSHDTAIVLAQNGIGIEDEYAELYPNNTIISGVVYLYVTQLSSGTVVQTTALDTFELGTFPASAPAKAKQQCEHLSSLWSAGGAHALVYDDIQAQRWKKVAINATMNPMTALTLCDDANLIRSSPGALDMLRDIIREVGRVAAADGYDVITEDVIEEHTRRQVASLESGGKESSMLTDVRNNREIEVEAILGNILRTAGRLGVETPYLRMLYVLAKGRNYAIAQTDGWRPIAKVN